MVLLRSRVVRQLWQIVLSTVSNGPSATANGSSVAANGSSVAANGSSAAANGSSVAEKRVVVSTYVTSIVATMTSGNSVNCVCFWPVHSSLLPLRSSRPRQGCIGLLLLLLLFFLLMV